MFRHVVVETRPQTYQEEEVLKWRTNVKRVFMNSTIHKDKSRVLKLVARQSMMVRKDRKHETVT
jgi:hypothetical protein